LLLLAADVSAQGLHRPRPGRDGNGGGPQRFMPVERGPEQITPRDASAPSEGRPRLSPEERRQLRRDVHQAGRDLYPDRLPPDRREPRRQ
jgi:hypothetical protein